MRIIKFFPFVAILLLGVHIAPVNHDARAQGALKETFGNWEKRCDTPPGARDEQCVLIQYVTAEDRDNMRLSVILMNSADGQSRVMSVLAPLGTYLPQDLQVRIDDEPVGKVKFSRCLPRGCIADFELEDQLLGLFQDGEVATFIIFQTVEEGIGIPITLKGLKDGYASLSNDASQ